MKAILNFRFVLIYVSVCFCSLNMYGQWDDYSGHADYQSHDNNLIMYLGLHSYGGINGFQIVPKDGGGNNHPVFQVNSRGKMILGTTDGTEHAFLDFMQQDRQYGSINTYNEDFCVDAVRKLWLSSRGHNAISIDGQAVALSGTLNISLPGLTPNAKVSIYNGVNDAPTLSCNQSKKWLRIGNDGGIALYGDSTYKQADADPTIHVAENKVSIKGNMKLKDGNVISYVGSNKYTDNGWIGTYSKHGLYIGTNNGGAMYVDSEQKIYLGLNMTQTTTIRRELKDKYKLFVTQGILSADYAIAPVGTWSDYVFNKDYTLRKLGDVDRFIKKNKHLPDVPSAADVAENGYSQHDMNKVLLKKVEELTLYAIEQNKKIAELEARLDNLTK